MRHLLAAATTLMETTPFKIIQFGIKPFRDNSATFFREKEMRRCLLRAHLTVYMRGITGSGGGKYFESSLSLLLIAHSSAFQRRSTRIIPEKIQMSTDLEERYKIEISEEKYVEWVFHNLMRNIVFNWTTPQRTVFGLNKFLKLYELLFYLSLRVLRHIFSNPH